MEKLIDSNLLIYTLIEDHPASSVCEAFIGRKNRYRKLYNDVDSVEVFHVLWRIYGLLNNYSFKLNLNL